MIRCFPRVAFAVGLMSMMLVAGNDAFAQKHGGILRVYLTANPPNLSILELATLVGEMPAMGIFNNLIMFDQHVVQVSLQSIVPDLAETWSWNETGTELTFKLRHGVKWHDGQPFTAKDVICTWDLMADNVPDKLRLNPRKSAYDNLESVTAAGDDEVTFHLKRPQPAFPMLLASGVAAIYPCHVTATQMRQHPIGTGPFKLCHLCRTTRSGSHVTWIIGNRNGLTSTGSSTRSSPIRRRRCWRSARARKT